MEIKRTVEDEDVEWTMEWGPNHSKHPPTELIFEPEQALALLLINEVVFLNEHWWQDWPKEAKERIGLFVICNDVFAWACADAEELPYKELEKLYKMWKKDPAWGPAVWCMIQRNQMPQKPVEDIIRKEGIWDLDFFNLEKN